MKKFFVSQILAALSLGVFAGESYNFYMVSDLHFGPEKTFSPDLAAPQKYRTKKEIQRSDRTLPEVKAMFEDMAKKSDEKTRFVYEAGDLIEGMTRDEKTHEAVLRDAISLMKSYFKYPIYMIRGNHDSYGPGGEEAYRAVLLPEIAKTIGQEKLEYANYTVTVGEDLFIFLDGHSRKGRAEPWKFAEKVLSEQKVKPRYVFVCVHAPFIPSYSNQAEIRAFRDRLLEYNAFLLCGHCHQNTVTVFEKEGKRLVQITVSSYLGLGKGLIHPAENTRDAYLESYREKLKTRWKQEAFLPEFEREWAPFITDYRCFDGGGYAKINVSDGGVSIDYQNRVLTQPPVTFQVFGANAEK